MCFSCQLGGCRSQEGTPRTFATCGLRWSEGCGHGFFPNIDLSTSQFQALGYGGQQPRVGAVRARAQFSGSPPRARPSGPSMGVSMGQEAIPPREGRNRAQPRGLRVIPRVKPLQPLCALWFQLPRAAGGPPPQPRPDQLTGQPLLQAVTRARAPAPSPRRNPQLGPS